VEHKNLVLIGAGILVGVGLGLVILAAIGIGSGFLFNRLTAGSGSEALQGLSKSIPAPDFKLEALDGSSLNLADLRGRPVLINFWATWCGPCQQEMPLIQQYYQKYNSDLVVLAVNSDEPKADVQAFVTNLNLTFPVLLDPGMKVEDLYQVRAFPTTFFVDKSGTIRYQHIGTLDEGQLVQYLAQLGVGE
jgi:cytochrome c biogenesis protein CcmG/thiol:disulfide interchange protein DsbE